MLCLFNLTKVYSAFAVILLSSCLQSSVQMLWLGVAMLPFRTMASLDEHRTVKMESLSTAGFLGIWHKQNIITLNYPDSKNITYSINLFNILLYWSEFKDNVDG